MISSLKRVDTEHGISIIGAGEELNASIAVSYDSDDVKVYDFEINAHYPVTPSPVTLQWKLPARNIKGVWKPTADFSKRIQADWELENMESRVSIDAPVIALFGNDDKNIMTFACSSAISKTELNARIREEDDCFYCHITFFIEEHSKIKNFLSQIRIDTSKIHFSKALKSTSQWWEGFDALKPSHVPPLANTPLYSTWYQFHQELDLEKLRLECEKAVQLGFETIIIDDGWQTNDNNRGYDFTGDWRPERIPQTKTFVEEIQKIGLKVGFWYSVPFCGKKSQAYAKFKGKFLTEDHRWAPVFDPRFPEVRRYLIDTYKRALIDWNLDGFKLDFIDDFKLYPDTEISDKGGRDYLSINKAVDRLMTDINNTLTAIKPNLFIEFRQKYTGPAMRKYGNMFRAFDCPGDATMNRVRIADIKMLCGETAVHSDMVTWHNDETLENAAIHIANTLFGVPQISVMLQELPESFNKMIASYLSFWNDNKRLLIAGDFTPCKPLANYPIKRTCLNDETIIGLYDDFVIDIRNCYDKIQIINAKLSKSVVLKISNDLGAFNCQVVNCLGELLSQKEIEIGVGLIEFDVPPGGIIKLEKNN